MLANPVTRSPLSGYPGGKFRLAPRLIPLFPKHKCYCEPFCGAAWPLFMKQPSSHEVINDINGEIVNLYRVCRDNYRDLLRLLIWSPNARQEFEFLARMPACQISALDNVRRAWRFLYLQKFGFGGDTQNLSWCVNRIKAGNKTALLNLIRDSAQEARFMPGLKGLQIQTGLARMSDRLRRVTIENMPYAACIEAYDAPGTFFYIDPPYHGSERDYGPVFSWRDFGALALLLKGLKGKFLLSINDTRETRAIFQDFHISASLDVNYSMNKEKPCRARELAISNYEIKGENF